MTLRRFNNLLSIVVILLGIYIFLVPFLPNIFFLFRDDSANAVAPYQGVLADSLGSTTTEAIPNQNRIVIPSIGLDEPIIESNSISAIADGGTWRRPNTATPNQQGNTVIVGHRFYQNSVSTFYHLDKIETREILAVYWEGQEYLYKVTDKKVVEATETEIEAPSSDSKLTLYTCHPLWSSTQRFVIVAEPYNSGGASEDDSR